MILSNTRALRCIILMSTAQSLRGIDLSRFKYINNNGQSFTVDDVQVTETASLSHYLYCERNLKWSEINAKVSIVEHRRSRSKPRYVVIVGRGQTESCSQGGKGGKTCLGVSKTEHISVEAGGVQYSRGRILRLLRLIDCRGRQNLVPKGISGYTGRGQTCRLINTGVLYMNFRRFILPRVRPPIGSRSFSIAKSRFLKEKSGPISYTVRGLIL